MPMLTRACTTVSPSVNGSRERRRGAARAARQAPSAPCGLLEEDGELVPAESGRGVVAAQARAEPARDLDEQLVAGCVTEAVVDRLEVVDIEEEQRQVGPVALRANERVLDAVGEQRAVRQTGEGVVERLVGEPLLELTTVGDVVRGDHHPLDGRVIEQVADDAFDGPHAAVGVPEVELEVDDALGQRREDLLAALGELSGVDDRREALADQRGGRVAEHRLDGWGDVANGQVALEHGDDVRRVLHECAEPRLAPPLEQVVAELDALDGERGLGRERRETLVDMPRERARPRHTDRAAQSVSLHDRGDERRRRPEPPERAMAAHLAPQLHPDVAAADHHGVVHFHVRSRGELDVDVRPAASTAEELGGV